MVVAEIQISWLEIIDNQTRDELLDQSGGSPRGPESCPPKFKPTSSVSGKQQTTTLTYVQSTNDLRFDIEYFPYFSGLIPKTVVSEACAPSSESID